jgi:hypothetical protein
MAEPNTTNSDYLGFFVKGKIIGFQDWLKFKDHFSNLKEYRKLKLKKLNKF